ncbi:SDR family oxidoreductase [Candidatus Bathyarchaeota archaeon]|jgi:meso-butanediol dehydrogenase / (S,S)-butanediol dehydrogenase / diacetyl reductase|nr:SDR family oxidoreductase [Candidatus Bathyarchaeota archaeon]MBT4320738.1 SDR family oxidoreductase [Candidatus Bathyarchaeota archaeon]MBT4424299.1 SDR family oxidoreductase [Candidatus Bathyarchaeota archaeon]MBT5642147.1 SDR family oxidoreductase [Candidatus Bathyarchaeota archaeon]MBT6604230.1 SDR family oxidoreductase [Candidatus Bathyarchaeota archaeon]
MGRLDGKVVIITGGGRGIGYTTAHLFSDEGAKLVINDIDEARGRKAADEINEKGGKAIFVSGDVSSWRLWERIVAETMKAYGRIDVLFNNAGISIHKSLETTEEEWDRVIDVNLKSVFLGSKAVVPIMKKQGRGNIVNNASEIGIVGAKNLLAYGAAKGGVVQMTKGLALDLASTGIRVNAICPGITATPLALKGIADHPNPEERRNYLEEGVPLRRMAKPIEQARAVLFLASDDSSFMTGTSLIVDGGWTAK